MAYLQRGERIARTLPEGVDVLNVALMKGSLGLFGKLYRRMGNAQQAREHLTTAITMYREMDMGFWLEQAEAEMGGRA
jgi:hypothetical protein